MKRFDTTSYRDDSEKLHECAFDVVADATDQNIPHQNVQGLISVAKLEYVPNVNSSPSFFLANLLALKFFVVPKNWSVLSFSDMIFFGKKRRVS